MWIGPSRFQDISLQLKPLRHFDSKTPWLDSKTPWLDSKPLGLTVEVIGLIVKPLGLTVKPLGLTAKKLLVVRRVLFTFSREGAHIFASEKRWQGRSDLYTHSLQIAKFLWDKKFRKYWPMECQMEWCWNVSVLVGFKLEFLRQQQCQKSLSWL